MLPFIRSGYRNSRKIGHFYHFLVHVLYNISWPSQNKYVRGVRSVQVIPGDQILLAV